MKHYLALAFFFMGLAAFGQTDGVTLHVDLKQDQFISNEDVIVVVRVTNRSGQTLRLGGDNQWLTYEVEDITGKVAAKLSNPNVNRQIVVPSAKTARIQVNITPHFNFRQPGRYMVTAYVRLPGIEKPLVSKAKPFDVFNGTQLQEFVVGVPPSFSGKDGRPETRRYVLQQANYLKELKLYFRVTDASGGHTIKVFPLANMLSFSRPEAQVDRFSNLHVLTQVGARSFLYCMLNPDGQMLVRQTHDYTETRPVLKLGADGRVFVKGGIQRISSSDLPPPSVDGAKNQ